MPTFDDPDLIIGAEGFSDAGAYRLRDDLLIVQSLDFFPPLVDDPFVFGQIAAANSLSDIYAMGARPVTVMNICAFPDDKLPLSILNEILRGGADRVLMAGAVVCGGHTVRDVEIKFGLSVTGVVEPERLLTNRQARPGDVLVLTKALGTGFITTAFKAGRCPDAALLAACESMIQLNAAASRAAQAHGVHASTDITGFGLAGHGSEMANASGVTLVLQVGLLPLLPAAEELAARGNKTRASASNRSFVAPQLAVHGSPDEAKMEFLFDAQTSGGLLLSVPEDQVDPLLRQLHAEGITVARVVGRVEARRDNCAVVIEA